MFRDVVAACLPCGPTSLPFTPQPFSWPLACPPASSVCHSLVIFFANYVPLLPGLSLTLRLERSLFGAAVCLPLLSRFFLLSPCLSLFVPVRLGAFNTGDLCLELDLLPVLCRLGVHRFVCPKRRGGYISAIAHCLSHASDR